MWPNQTDAEPRGDYALLQPQPLLTARTYQGLELASFWRRAGGSVLDNLILRFASAPLIAAAESSSDLSAGLILVAVLVAPIIYKAGFESNGATPGKMVVGVKVVDPDMNQPGLKRAARRVILPIAYTIALVVLQTAAAADTPDTEFYGWFKTAIAISIGLMVLLIIDSLWMTWDDGKQTLRDKIGGTYVVRSR